MIFGTTFCAKVVDGVATAGLFRDLIKPAAPLSGGLSEARAKADHAIYPIQSHAETETHKAVSQAPAYDAGDDTVYDTQLVARTVAERKTYLRAKLVEQFEFHRDKGVTINGASVMTTPQAQSELKALQDDLDGRAAGGESNPTQKIATRAGDVITATPEIAAGLVAGVTVHIRAVWDNDAVLQDAINNATTHSALDAIDLTAGWPA
jgi:hypothetical protein